MPLSPIARTVRCTKSPCYGGIENRFGFTPDVGSNPTPSTILPYGATDSLSESMFDDFHCVSLIAAAAHCLGAYRGASGSWNGHEETSDP
jgi:hypothetical protein